MLLPFVCGRPEEAEGKTKDSLLCSVPLFSIESGLFYFAFDTILGVLSPPMFNEACVLNFYET